MPDNTHLMTAKGSSHTWDPPRFMACQATTLADTYSKIIYFVLLYLSLVSQPWLGALDSSLDNSVGLVHGIENVGQTRVISVHQPVLAKVKR